MEGSTRRRPGGGGSRSRHRIAAHAARGDSTKGSLAPLWQPLQTKAGTGIPATPPSRRQTSFTDGHAQRRPGRESRRHARRRNGAVAMDESALPRAVYEVLEWRRSGRRVRRSQPFGSKRPRLVRRASGFEPDTPPRRVDAHSRPSGPGFGFGVPRVQERVDAGAVEGLPPSRPVEATRLLTPRILPPTSLPLDCIVDVPDGSENRQHVGARHVADRHPADAGHHSAPCSPSSRGRAADCASRTACHSTRARQRRRTWACSWRGACRPVGRRRNGRACGWRRPARALPCARRAGSRRVRSPGGGRGWRSAESNSGFRMAEPADRGHGHRSTCPRG